MNFNTSQINDLNGSCGLDFKDFITQVTSSVPPMAPKQGSQAAEAPQISHCRPLIFKEKVKTCRTCQSILGQDPEPNKWHELVNVTCI